MKPTNYKIIFLMVVLIVVGTIINIIIHNNINEKEQLEINNRNEMANQTMRIQTYMCLRRLDDAMSIVDIYIKRYPNSPNGFWTKAQIYELKNDSVNAHKYHLFAYEKYDSLIRNNNDFGDKINHAMLTQILYGVKAFNDELDSLRNKTNDSKELSEIELFQGTRYNIYELYPETKED